MKYVDLSLPIDDQAFEVHRVAIDRVSHRDGVELFNKVALGRSLWGKLKYLAGARVIERQDLPDGEFLSLETVHASVHSGTHLDYSFHYGSRSEGRASRTAEEIPLNWCCGDGVKLDLTHKRDAEEITGEDLAAALATLGYALKPLDIVLLQTGRDRHYGGPRYFSDFPGVSPPAIDFLLDRGIRVFGIDTMSIDLPYRVMLGRFLKTRDPNGLWPAHFHGRKREFVHIERLGNLEHIPALRFKVMCFPVRIRQTGAAWSRVVAAVADAD